MPKNRNEIRAKKHPREHEITPFFFFKNFPDPPTLAPSELIFAALIEITWLRLCTLSPAKRHDKHTYLSSLGMLGTTQLNSFFFLQIT